MRGLGLGLIFGFIFPFAVCLGGYLQTYTRSPITEPVKWFKLDAQHLEEQRAKFRQRNVEWRPKLGLATLISLALMILGIVLVVVS